MAEIEADEVCEMPGCIQFAESLQASIDSSANPCENFYQYSCGKWLANNEIPEDETRIGSFNSADDIMNENLNNSLKNQTEDRDSGPIQTAKTFYATCLNVAKRQEEGVARLKQLISEYSGGGWPLAEFSWDESRFDWHKTLIRLSSELNVHPLFVIGPDLNLWNTSQHVLTIDYPRDLPLPLFSPGLDHSSSGHGRPRFSEHHPGKSISLMDWTEELDAPAVQDHKNDTKEHDFIARLAPHFTNSNVSSERLETGIERLMLTGANIKKYKSEAVSSAGIDDLYSNITLAKLDTDFPHLRIGELIRTIVSNMGQSIKPSDIVQIASPIYFTALDEAIAANNITKE